LTEFRHVSARRRALLGAGLVAATTGGIAAREARAQQKLAKNLIMYQETPKGDQRCDNCTHWQPPNACAIVEGHILPQAWCGAWAPKT
jgi:hypothetical protein